MIDGFVQGYAGGRRDADWCQGVFDIISIKPVNSERMESKEM